MLNTTLKMFNLNEKKNSGIDLINVTVFIISRNLKVKT